MKRLTLFALVLLPAILGFGQDKTPVDYNLGFERVTTGKELPDNWIRWGTSNYELKIDTLIKNSGRSSVLIESRGESDKNSFGCIAFAIPFNFEAKEIELRAYMKLNTVGPIGLMLRMDGASGMLGFENMQSQNIHGTKDWTAFSVKIPNPEGGKTLYVGAILSGRGQLWVDDLQVLLDGKDIWKASIVKQKEYKADLDKEFDTGSGISKIVLTQSVIEDLDILGKVWGYLKYYHPRVAAGDFNWDYELFRIAPKILDAKNADERNAELNTWATTLGNLEADKDSGQPLPEIKLAPDLSWVNSAKVGTDLTSSLNLVKRAKRSEEHYYIGKVGGVGNPVFRNERAFLSMSYPDPGFRLLSLYRYWNMIQYYFPYKNLIGEDWNNVLKEYIPKFVSASNELEYKLATLSLIARIHDTHANIWGNDLALNGFRGRRYAPLEITFVENKAVVTDYIEKFLAEKSGLKIGDEIVSINGQSVADIVKDRLLLTPASNYPTQLRDIGRNLLRSNESFLDITYSNAKSKGSLKLETYSSDEMNPFAKFQRKDTCFKMINPDIAYLYPGSVKNAYLPKIMAEVLKAKGLIIDFRCYPSDFTVFSLSEYLLPEEKGFVRFSNGSVKTPGLFSMNPEIKVGKSNPAYYRGIVVILINETTQSSAEYHTMAFRTAPKATVVGSTTAGADGNVSRIVLPGGINTMISGIGVYYPDGRETQRVGIVPDIDVSPTIDGIRKKKDELLERAIQVIMEGQMLNIKR